MISFFTTQPLAEGSELALGEDAVGHARARRVEPGDAARLLDGQGTIAAGRLVAIEKRRLLVRVDDVTRIPRPPGLEVLVPIADKDRMLLAAEKCAELQVTAWQPVFYARSRSVNPRGEGPRFREKVEARMRAALEQSGGAWLPAIGEDAEFETAVRAVEQARTRIILDSRGTSLAGHIGKQDITLAVGPEGGLTDDELGAAHDLGWRTAALAHTVLRFETAVIAAVGTVRALQYGR